jgi:hypothetical protein
MMLRYPTNSADLPCSMRKSIARQGQYVEVLQRQPPLVDETVDVEAQQVPLGLAQSAYLRWNIYAASRAPPASGCLFKASK